MHIHLGKWLHGWREFLKEYAIVVLGVLTALALDQLVDAAHERRIAREARAAINQELQDDLDRAAYLARQQSCIMKRLDEVQALVAGWQDDSAFSPGLHIGFPGDVGQNDQRWQANLTSDRFSQQTPAEQADQAGLYTLVHVIDKVGNSEIESWSRLRALELGSQALSMGSKPMIVEALVSARNQAEALDHLTSALTSFLGTGAPGRPAMVPSKDYNAAFRSTACQPIRGASNSSGA
jgi:type II secretory pathway pseudopilin PulG